MPTTTEKLLRWRPSKGGPAYTIHAVLDPDDFDVDQETEERFPRILGFRISQPPGRGGEFAWGAKDCLKWPRYLAQGKATRFLPAPSVRVTTRGFSWDYTPDHVPVFPGSVSNPALLTSGGSATGGASNTSASFTPTASALMVASFTSRNGGPPQTTHAYSDSFVGSGAWTDIEAIVATSLTHSQGYMQVGATPGSGTVTCTFGAANAIRASWIIAEVTGHDTTTPLSESATNAGTGTTLSITLGGIAAGNMAIGTIGDTGGVITPGTDETELADVASGGTGPVETQMEYGTTVTIDWSSLDGTANAGVAIEYAAAASTTAYNRRGMLTGVGSG